MNIVLDPLYNWTREQAHECTYWYAGDLESVKPIVEFFAGRSSFQATELKDFLCRSAGNFGLILKTKDLVFACTDKIRSYPLFYAESPSLSVSNSARKLQNDYNLTETDPSSLLELQMAGYVTDRQTLYRNLYQLQAGEFLLSKNNELTRDRYYLFYSQRVRLANEDDLIEELDSVTDVIFERIVKKAGGRPIWIPLSGGLDSRLILCKLKQLKYDNLHSFSYGPPRNYEAIIAREMAQRVGVPWRFIPSYRQSLREYFWSTERKKYWEYADGLHIVPNIHWIDSMKTLVSQRLVSDDAIFINGQSGDFICGDHIPALPAGARCDEALFGDRIVLKHFSQMAEHLKDREAVDAVKRKVLLTLRSCTEDAVHDHQSLGKLWELWEWQERQCKRVINGQRTYDYFGFQWELPLWADEYLRYWVDLPVANKIGRNLFKKYLAKKNFYGVFGKTDKPVQRWPSHLRFILYSGQMISVLFGGKIAKKYYQYMDYFSHYSHFYAPFSYWEYVKHCQKHRGAVSFFGRIYEKELLGLH